MVHVIAVHSLFFCVGIFQDLLITYYYQVIVKEFPLRSAISSSLVTLVNILVLYEILSGIEHQVLSVILVYAVGNGVGTFFIMKRHHIRRWLARRTKSTDSFVSSPGV